MKVTTRTHGGVIVVVLTHKGFGQEGFPLRDTIVGIAKSRQPRFLIDLTQVSFMGSIEVGELVRAYKRVIEAGGTMKLLLLRGSQVQKVIELTRLNKVFECYEDELAALDSF